MGTRLAQLFIDEFEKQIIERHGLKTCVRQALGIDTSDNDVYLFAIIADSNGDERRVKLDDTHVVYSDGWTPEDLLIRMSEVFHIEEDGPEMDIIKQRLLRVGIML